MGNFKGGMQGCTPLLSRWKVLTWHHICFLLRNAEQPDAEQLAFNHENDDKGTGVETIVVCPKMPIETIVALMDPSEVVGKWNLTS